jgi:hypothetical protein
VRRGRRLEREACSRLGHCACGSTNQGWRGDGAGARARAWWRRLKPLGNYQALASRTSASTLCALGRRGRAARWAERIGRAGPRRWEGAGPREAWAGALARPAGPIRSRPGWVERGRSGPGVGEVRLGEAAGGFSFIFLIFLFLYSYSNSNIVFEIKN